MYIYIYNSFYTCWVRLVDSVVSKMYLILTLRSSFSHHIYHACIYSTCSVLKACHVHQLLLLSCDAFTRPFAFSQLEHVFGIYGQKRKTNQLLCCRNLHYSAYFQAVCAVERSKKAKFAVGASRHAQANKLSLGRTC